MPVTFEVVEKKNLRSKLREYERRGYRCRSDEDGDWECVKPINEAMVDIRLLVVKS